LLKAEDQRHRTVFLFPDEASLSLDDLLSNREFQQILKNRRLARLGDAYVNFLFSLALTKASGIPVGVKVSDRILFEAAKNSGIRPLLPRRIKRGEVANVIEALVVDSWMRKSLELNEMVDIISKNSDNLTEAATQLVKSILERMRNH
jgi:hypothetical protein